MSMELKIAHLYPDDLCVCGDGGNVRCMVQRLRWRGIDCSVRELVVGSDAPYADFDLFFMGGGEEFEVSLMDDLRNGRAGELRAAIEAGKTFLCVGGGMQLLGKLGIVDIRTEAGEKRHFGNYVYQMDEADGGHTVIGFENHAGRTFLGEGLRPMGTVVNGYGNNGADMSEGLRYKNVFGCYSHGPVLPLNPALCDLLLETALCHKYGEEIKLEPLADGAEAAARSALLKRLTGKGKE